MSQGRGWKEAGATTAELVKNREGAKQLLEKLEDPEFKGAYEKAVEGLSGEDLTRLTNMNDQQVITWVLSPPAVRKQLLIKKIPFEKVDDVFGELADHLEKRLEDTPERQKRREENRRRKIKI